MKYWLKQLVDIGQCAWRLRRHLRPGAKPRLAIVDLKDLDEPGRVLRDLAVLMKPERVVVLAATATVSPSEVSRLGFQVLRRPLTIATIVATVTRTLSAPPIA